jgi:hypothetical protein
LWIQTPVLIAIWVALLGQLQPVGVLVAAFLHFSSSNLHLSHLKQ